jgi:HK97 family phage major capsid protein
MTYKQELQAKLARISAAINVIIEAAKKDNNRGLSSEEREKFHALESDYTATEDSIKAAERSNDIVAQLALTEDPNGVRINEQQMEELRAQFRLSPAEKRRRDNAKDPHAKAFSAYLREGETVSSEVRGVLARYNAGVGLSPEISIRNTMSTTTSSQGGALVPQGFSGMLEEAKKWFGGIEGVTGKFTTGTGNPFPWPTVNDTTNRGAIIGQNVQVSEVDLVFGQVTFNAYIGTSNAVLIPLALIDDSFFDMDALVARLLGIRLGRLFNWKCSVGTGTNEPTGIVTAAVAAGNVLQLTTGNTSSIAYNNLVDLEHSIDPVYRYTPSTRFMFSDTELKLIKKLVDGNNRPLWQPGLTSSFREGAAVDLVASKPTILDHPYVINQDMATPAASAYSVLFGEMDAFKVREVAGGTTVMVLRERYADYLQVGYTAFQRFDSNLIDAGTHPIAVLQQSSS